MKRLKQVLALIGIGILILLYGLTLFAAILDSTATLQYLSAAIAATVLIPITLWLFIRMTEIRNKNKEEKEN
ncbi:MAG: hypothetical protein PUB19_03505 [Lachnospiraceae bacterium]|nr:hypothetical protein [Lachnospiraceae bacterium]